MKDTLKKALKGTGTAAAILVVAFGTVKLAAPELMQLSQFKSMLIQAIISAVLAWGVIFFSALTGTLTGYIVEKI